MLLGPVFIREDMAWDLTLKTFSDEDFKWPPTFPHAND